MHRKEIITHPSFVFGLYVSKRRALFWCRQRDPLIAKWTGADPSLYDDTAVNCLVLSLALGWLGDKHPALIWGRDLHIKRVPSTNPLRELIDMLNQTPIPVEKSSRRPYPTTWIENLTLKWDKVWDDQPSRLDPQLIDNRPIWMNPRRPG